MAYEEIIYTVTDRVATITLNRPERLNAWTPLMGQEVRSAMKSAAEDSAVNVIVFTGAGRGFCSGADLEKLESGEELRIAAQREKEYVEQQARSGSMVRADFMRKYSYFPAIPKPIISAINGPAAGLGLILILFCDLRFASEKARFSTAFSRRGLIAEYGISWMLPRIVGLSNALDLFFSARLIDAQEALRMGLVDRVFPSEGFMEGVLAYAGEIATSVSPRSIRVIKKQVFDGLFQTLSEAIEVADREMLLSIESEDFREGVASFIQKRPPLFTGK